MKINIVREKPNLYFAEVVGVEGARAQGETPERTLEYLIDVYEKVIDLRKSINAKKLKKSSIQQKMPSLVKGLSFKKLQFSL